MNRIDVIILTPTNQFQINIQSLDIQKARYFGASTINIQCPVEFFNTTNSISYGDTVCVYENGTLRFKAMIYSIDATNNPIKIKGFDLLHKFKNPCLQAFSDITYTEFVRQACLDLMLPMGEIQQTGYTKDSLLLKGKEYYNGIKTLHYDTLMNTDNIFLLRDNNGRIELINNLELRTPYAIYEGGNLISYSISGSIEDCANEVVVMSSGDNSGIQEIEQDIDKIQRWGVMRKIEEFPALKFYNYPKTTMTLEVIGSFEYDAGTICKVIIPSKNINKFIIIEEVAYSITPTSFTTSITAKDTVGV